MTMMTTKADTRDTSPRDVSGPDTTTSITIVVHPLADSNRITISTERRAMAAACSTATTTIDAGTSGRVLGADRPTAK